MALTLTAGQTLVCATHNPGKAVELAELLDGRFKVVTAAALDLAEPEETESTFIGNAVLKARAAADVSGLTAVADDSGLSVEGLAGAPGIYSARWAATATGRDFTAAMDRVREELQACAGSPNAVFVCALAVAWPNGPVVAVEGRAHGRVAFPPRGDRGFGYDPIFIAEGASLTWGEIDPALKKATSHRADAFAKLKAALF
jgi:XTP/dITP diphosphohydrolase